MSDHNTQLPTSVELGEKPKWEVRRRWSDFYCDYAWAILNPDGSCEGDLETWREAMDYADEQAHSIPVEIIAPPKRYKTRFKLDESDKRLLDIIALHYQKEVEECPGQPANPA